MENFKFIGRDYESEEERQEILKTSSKFFLSKVRYVNESNRIGKNSKNKYLRSITKITAFENKYDKDLMLFSKDEIVNLYKDCKLMSPKTKQSLFSFGNTYCNYCIKKGEIKVNQFNGLKIKTISGNLEYYKSRLSGMDEFYKICEEMIKKTGASNIKPLLLARYGIAGVESESIRNLKYSDIDMENMVINVVNNGGGSMHYLPIDLRFVDMLTRLSIKDSKELGTDILNSDKYILNINSVMNYNTMLSKTYKACEAIKITRITLGDLLFTRRLEMLLAKRKERKLNKTDIVRVLTQFNNGNKKVTESVIAGIREGYVLLTEDTIKAGHDNSKLEDINSKEFAERISDNLDLCIAYENLPSDVHYTLAKSKPDLDYDMSNYPFVRRDKKELVTIPSKETYPRDSRVTILALNLRRYECSVNKSHDIFISQATSRNYVEGHHIIPVSNSARFDADIDNEANVIALCPNCHRLLHYGRMQDKKSILEKIYDENIDNLRTAGLFLEKLDFLDMYNKLFVN